MDVLSVLSSLAIGAISLFLAFSSMAESAVVSTMERFGYERVVILYETSTTTAPTRETSEAIEDASLSVIPSLYEKQEYGGPIPSILLSAPTQKATVIEATRNETPRATSTSLSLEVRAGSSIEDALVNVFCTLRTGKEIRATTGSGVFIDSRGVILTNAHVAQFLLLANDAKGIRTKCSIRRGSPAVAEYAAELLYIPPLWVSSNAKELQSDNPSGTGERDYALLYITETILGERPAQFPALPFDTEPLGNGAKNQAVLAAGFPAEILKTDGPKAHLRPVIATTTITELFTYTRNKVDLVGIAPSAVGEGGSSGGPVVTLEGTVIGIISTRGDSVKDGAKSLRAITLAYIDRTIKEETGVQLREYLKDQLPLRAQIFRETLSPLLSRIVIDAIRE